MTSYLLNAGARTDLQDADGDTAQTMVLLQQIASTNSWKVKNIFSSSRSRYFEKSSRC